MAAREKNEKEIVSDDDEWVSRGCYRFSRHRKRGRVISTSQTYLLNRGGRCNSKHVGTFTTKSCDSIFFQAVRVKESNTKISSGSSIENSLYRHDGICMWQRTTRSEEHIPRISVRPNPSSNTQKTGVDKKINYSLPSILHGGRKTGGLGFFGKIGNRRRQQTNSPVLLGRAFSPHPWVLVEFSRSHDFPQGDSDNESDHSFELAVAKNAERIPDAKPSLSVATRTEGTSDQRIPDASRCATFLKGSSAKNTPHRKYLNRLPMKSESVPRHCLAPDDERNKSCGLRLAVTPRPHTLGIRGKLAVPSGVKALEASTGKFAEELESEGAVGEMLPARNIPRMPSLESIGSCSLDADVTASECSEAVGITASQRTLHSISFVDFSPLRTTEDSGVQPALGPSDSADKIVDNSLSPHTSSPNTVTSPRPPSYVSLSCSISGYSPLAAYDSELRKGFRTGRDANQTADPSYIPVKQTLSAGDHENNNIRDTSGASGMENNKASVCSPNHRKPCVGARDMNGSLQSQNNGDEKGHNSDVYSYKSGPTESHAGTVRIVQFTSQNKSYVRTVTRTFDSGVHGSNVTEEHSSSPNFITPSKSFIQQRVERLYGPGALAQGFFKRTSHRSVSSGGKSTSFSESGDDVVSPRPCASLPVLRHLRPEFRNQLPVRGTSPKVPPVVTIIPITVEGIEPSPDKEKDLSALEAEKEEDLCKSKVNDVIVTAPPDLCPAAPDVVLPPVLIEGAPDVTNGIAEVIISQESKPNDGVVKDGHYFIRLLKSEIARLTKLVDSAEEELARGVDGENPLPEEAAGWLRSAAGQARLLMRQKMQQFEGLCQKHLLQSPGEAFPTTLEDLAGFWDMVLLQVASVDAMFQEIDTLRASGWVETPSKTAPPKDGKVDSTSGSAAGGDGSKGHKKQTVRKPQLTASASSTKTSGAAKARDEARRKMMEERRRAMKERQKESAGEGSIQGEVEIFVPDNK